MCLELNWQNFEMKKCDGKKKRKKEKIPHLELNQAPTELMGEAANWKAEIGCEKKMDPLRTQMDVPGMERCRDCCGPRQQESRL